MPQEAPWNYRRRVVDEYEKALSSGDTAKARKMEKESAPDEGTDLYYEMKEARERNSKIGGSASVSTGRRKQSVKYPRPR